MHDWLVVYGGAEKVLEQLIKLYPDAEIFCIVDFIPAEKRTFLHNKIVNTSFIQNLPFAKRIYRSYLPIMPYAIEQFDLSAYDLIISSSYAVAKGVIIGPNQLHICYCHSPIRYAWDLQYQYLRESNLDHGIKGLLAKYCLHKIRIWDSRTSNGVDAYIANSKFISKRIYKIYRRNSTIIYPPVDVDTFFMSDQKEDYYLTASRMVSYKRMDLIVEAFSKMPQKKLVVIGDGPEYKKIYKKASKNIIMLGYQSNESLRHYMQHAKAFVFAAQEDFGIIPIEAQACGTPVVAYAKGGALETVRGLDKQNPTGVLFEEQSASSIIEAINTLEKKYSAITPLNCRLNAEKFSSDRFFIELSLFIKKQIENFF